MNLCFSSTSSILNYLSFHYILQNLRAQLSVKYSHVYIVVDLKKSSSEILLLLFLAKPNGYSFEKYSPFTQKPI